jgi:hypothetical protein
MALHAARLACGPLGRNSGGSAGRFAGPVTVGVARNRRVSTPTVSTAELYQINWADVAARARADLGDERVAHISERIRTVMLAVAASVRAGGSEGVRFGSMPEPDLVARPPMLATSHVPSSARNI